MSERKRPGEPESRRRPAGAPEEEARPAGIPAEQRPTTNPAGPDASAQSSSRRSPSAGSEDSAGGGSEEAARAEVERDLDELAETQRERDEYLELARRARADFENYRKRAARETAEAERRGRSTLARQLVPVLDNLERALRAAGIDPDTEPSGEEEASGDGGGLGHGVRLVFRELRETLAHAGVEAYDPTGEKFDPTWHEALATRPADGAEPGTVLETVEKGYRLDGQVLRAARVIVSE